MKKCTENLTNLSNCNNSHSLIYKLNSLPFSRAIIITIIFEFFLFFNFCRSIFHFYSVFSFLSRAFFKFLMLFRGGRDRGACTLSIFFLLFYFQFIKKCTLIVFHRFIISTHNKQEQQNNSNSMCVYVCCCRCFSFSCCCVCLCLIS